jgi:hypothetical protein
VGVFEALDLAQLHKLLRFGGKNQGHDTPPRWPAAEHSDAGWRGGGLRPS